MSTARLLAIAMTGLLAACAGLEGDHRPAPAGGEADLTAYAAIGGVT